VIDVAGTRPQAKEKFPPSIAIVCYRLENKRSDGAAVFGGSAECRCSPRLFFGGQGCKEGAVVRANVNLDV